MKDVIEALTELKDDLGGIQDFLQGQEWPSRAITLIANDLNTWLGMAASSAETLLHLLVGLESAKAEVKEIIEEEESGEVPSEQVPEPEDLEASGEIPPQEPGDEKPPGD